jgi:hypothetical protein
VFYKRRKISWIAERLYRLLTKVSASTTRKLSKINDYKINKLWNVRRAYRFCAFALLLPLDFQFKNVKFRCSFINSVKQAGYASKDLKCKSSSNSVQRFCSYELTQRKNCACLIGTLKPPGLRTSLSVFSTASVRNTFLFHKYLTGYAQDACK